jgi:hypothetical protein
LQLNSSWLAKIAKQAEAFLAQPTHLGLVISARADRFGRSVGQTRSTTDDLLLPRASAAHGIALAADR